MKMERWMRKIFVVGLIATGIFWLRVGGMAASTPILGELSWPEEWVVFAPLERDDPVLSEDILKTIPTEILVGERRIKAQTVTIIDPYHRFDFVPLFGGGRDFGQHMETTAYIFLPLVAPQDMEVTLGMGADWWMQAWVNGRLVLDTTATGNVAWPPSVGDHTVNVKLRKGKNVLAVRFISGSGSSVLALGGPNALRQGAPTRGLIKAIDVPLPEGNIVRNADFEAGETVNPFIPPGWKTGAGEAAFREDELLRHTLDPLSGRYSLEINTLGSGEVKRKIYTRIAVDITGLYRISYQGRHIAGDGYVSISVRQDTGAGDISFLHATGNVNLRGGFGRGGQGEYRGYFFFDTPRPYLVVQTRGPIHVVLDNIAITPIADKSRMWVGWRHQRVPKGPEWHTLTEEIVTPHTRWARPLAGGKLNVLSIMPRWEHRRTVELAQRLSMYFDTIVFATGLTPGGDYWVRDAEGDPALFRVEVEAMRQLEHQRDVIIIAELNPAAIPPLMVKAILKQVEAGAGLVITSCMFDGRLALEKFKQGPWARALNPKNRTEEQIQYVVFNRHHRRTAANRVAFYRYGQGRIVFWGGFISDRRSGFEKEMSYMIKAMLWASRRVPEIKITSVELPGESTGTLSAQIKRRGLPALTKVTLTSSSPIPSGTRLLWWIEDPHGEEITREVLTLKTGQSQATFELPVLPAGDYRISFQVKEKNGLIQDWNTAVLKVTTEPSIKEIRLREEVAPFYTAGDTVRGHVVLTAALPSDQKVRLRLIDADGNLWQAKDLSGQGPELKFAVNVDNPLVLIHRLQAQIVDREGVLLAEAEQEFTVVRAREWYEYTFDYFKWAVPQGWSYLSSYQVLRKLREHGITTGMGNFASPHQVLHNIRAIPPTGVIEWGALEHRARIVGDRQQAPERDPCITCPDYRQRLRQWIEKWDVARRGAIRGPHLAPLAYSLGHELNLRAYGTLCGQPDICFSPSCLSSLRNFLRREYPSLTALNQSWGTNFKDWEEVSPIVLDEAIKSDQIERWIDHRRHMDWVWMDHWRFVMQVVREHDPHALAVTDNPRVGLTVHDSFSGIDYCLFLSEVFAGGSGLPTPYLLSFIPPEHRHLTWLRAAGWHPITKTDNDSLFRQRFGNRPWEGLLQGFRGFGYYSEPFFALPDCNMNLVLAPDLRTADFARWVNEPVAQIRTGLDRFVFESIRDHSGIAILFSRSSEHAATAWQAIHKDTVAHKLHPPGQVGFFSSALRSLGYRFNALSEAQVARGALRDGNYQLLIMPFSQAILPETVREIADFVYQGGALLADIRPAMANEHGKLGQYGLLDEVFGVRHRTDWRLYVPIENSLQIAADLGNLQLHTNLSSVIIGPAVSVKGATQLGRSGEVPALIVNRYGSGKAILLNFAPQQVNREVLEVLAHLLNWYGLQPLFQVETLEITRPEPLVRRVRRAELPRLKETVIKDAEDLPGVREGEGWAAIEVILGQERPTLASFTNKDIHIFGLWYDHHDQRRGSGQERLRIVPPRAGHVYDLQTNEYLGWLTEFETTIALEGLAVFAVTPDKIEHPTISLSLYRTHAGLYNINCQILIYPVETRRQSHVVKIQVFAPDGTEWKDFAVTRTAPSGKVEHDIVLPKNAPRGTWTIQVREAISGLASKEKITVHGSRLTVDSKTVSYENF